MATLPPCSPVMLVVTRGHEGSRSESVEESGELCQWCGGGGPVSRLLLKSPSLGKPLCSRLGILLGGQFRDETRAHVLADDAAVDLATAGVVATVSPAGLPAHRVV